MTINFVTTGTVAVTSGGKFLVGTGTLWTDETVKQGDTIWVNGRGEFWIDTLDEALQHITLVQDMLGATASGLTFAIKPTSPEWFNNITINKHLSEQIVALDNVSDSMEDAVASTAADAASADADAATATAQAAISTAQAVISTAQAVISTTQAGIATTKASDANTAKLAAESALASTLAAYDSFDDRYLGAKAANPTLDNDGNALVAGALYFNTVSGEMRFWNGTAWGAAYVPGVASSIAFTPTGNVAATTVQAAIAEVDSEKLSLAGGTLTGVLLLDDSTNVTTAPVLSFDGDANTGIGRSAADTLDFVTAGVDRLQITSAGVVSLIIGQLAFPATQNPSSGANVFDDYEEGTGVPTVLPTGGSFSSVSASSAYEKIARFVQFHASISITNGGSATGILSASLPFAASSIGESSSAMREYIVNGTQNTMTILPAGTTVSFNRYDNTAPATGTGAGYQMGIGYGV